MTDFFPQFAQQLVNGLTLGAIYALIAIGYSMVYGIIGMINFAHGEIYMIGAYVGLVTHRHRHFRRLSAAARARRRADRVGDRHRPVRFRGRARRVSAAARARLVPLISAIGMSIFLQNYVQIGGARATCPCPC